MGDSFDDISKFLLGEESSGNAFNSGGSKLASPPGIEKARIVMQNKENPTNPHIYKIVDGGKTGPSGEKLYSEYKKGGGTGQDWKLTKVQTWDWFEDYWNTPSRQQWIKSRSGI